MRIRLMPSQEEAFRKKARYRECKRVLLLSLSIEGGEVERLEREGEREKGEREKESKRGEEK
jgi:hypothetical protein